MPTSTLFAYHRTGARLVIGDGDEVLVYGGDDERPLWKDRCAAEVAAVGVTATEVVAVDEAGAVSRWDAAEGRRLPDAPLGAAPRAFALAESGVCAVALPDAVVLVERAATGAIPVEGARALAMNAGGRVALGTVTGRVAVHGPDGALVGACELGAPVRSLAWNAGGFWLAAAGDGLFRVDPHGASHERVTRAPGAAPDCVACSTDGSRIALRLEPGKVVVLAYPSRSTVATVAYADRAVVGLGFGPDAWLGVGLDKGDSNKIDLRTGAVHRTDPHADRPRNTWILQVAIERAAAPGAPPQPADAPAPDAGSSRVVGLALFLVALLVVLVVLHEYGSVDSRSPLSAADQAEVARLAEQARVRGDALAAERRAGLEAALASLVPRPDLGPCPVDVRSPPLDSPRAIASEMDLMLSTHHIAVLPIAEAASRASPAATSLSERLGHLTGDERAQPDSLAEARDLADPSWWTHDMVVAVLERVDPEVGDAGYRSGLIVGRAFVWSYRDHAVVCAANVLARNSPQVRIGEGQYEPGAAAYVRGDLLGRAAEAARAGLYRAGPRLAAATPADADDAGTEGEASPTTGNERDRTAPNDRARRRATSHDRGR